MIPEKLKYSKCPNCQKNGLTAWLKTSHGSNPIVECIHCGKKYRINFIVSMLFYIFLGAFWGFCELICREAGYSIPPLLIVLFLVVCFLVFQYFAPLQKVDDTDES